MWARLLNAGLGIWLMAAPAVLGYGGDARIVHRILGPIAASAAIIAIWQATRPMRHLNLALGGILLLTPWVLGSSTTATVNSIAVGIAMIGLSRIRGRVDQRLGGGWAALWRGEDPLIRQP